MTVPDAAGPAADQGPSARFLELAARSRRELVAAMRRGSRPDPASLAGWEFRGLNTAAFLRVVGADRFVKGFPPEEAGRRGDNRRVGRGGRADPWLAPTVPLGPPFAPYLVEPVDPTRRDNRYLDALLLDYGRGGGRRLDPSRPLRDYLVRIDDGLLLGHAFTAIGPARIEASFFVLESLRPLT